MKWFLPLLLLAGCATQKLPDRMPTDGGVIMAGLGQAAWGYSVSAEYDIDEGIKHVESGGCKDKFWKDFFVASKVELGRLREKLTGLLKAQQIWTDQYNEIHTKNTQLSEKLTAEQGHFWSYQQRLWWKWIVGLGLASIIGLVIWHFAAGGTIFGVLPFSAVFRTIFRKPKS